MIYIVNKRRAIDNIAKEYPNAEIFDITSSSSNPQFRLLSPFYPHGNIPVPFSPKYKAMSVEGIWQGLKVFSDYGIDENSFLNDKMSGLKRTVRKYGKILGHQKGVNSSELLNYLDARLQIYLPTYKWVLDNIPQVQYVIEMIKIISTEKDVVLLDYNTNIDFRNMSSPLSHAGLVKLYIEGKYPNKDFTHGVSTIEKKTKKNKLQSY